MSNIQHLLEKQRVMKVRDIPKDQYASIHHWIRNNYGKASKCVEIDCKGICKVFQWALKKGEKYDRNINHFLELCASCHSKYDMDEEKRRRFREVNINTNKTHCIKGHPFTKENTMLFIQSRKDETKGRKCRTCAQTRTIKWKGKNRAKIREYEDEYRKKNREKMRTYYKKHNKTRNDKKRLSSWLEGEKK